jgi:hypothetical protein
MSTRIIFEYKAVSRLLVQGDLQSSLHARAMRIANAARLLDGIKV